MINLLNKTFIALTIIMSVRVPMFFLSDSLKVNPALNLAIIPHIPIAAILTVLFIISLKDVKDKRYLVLFLILSAFSFLSPSRGHAVILVLSLGTFFFIGRLALKYTGYILLILAFFGSTLILVYFYNPRLFDFFLWKFSFFAGDISDSGRIRLYEFYNILAEALWNPMYLLFGKGLSGYFTYANFPLPSNLILDLKSYSYDELMENIYYHPHFFTNFVMLKFGIVGLAIYIFFIASYFRYSLSLFRRFKSNVAENPNFLFYSLFNVLFSISLLFEMFFRNYFAMLFSINFLTLYFLWKNSRLGKDCV